MKYKGYLRIGSLCALLARRPRIGMDHGREEGGKNVNMIKVK